ncbi:MAG: gamma carbonic anhydrase family protein [Oscillospiraceae bacterium]|nr:gamma carbonic anhydrase family protein [Oscillospiraceae bacterium]
MKTPVIHPSAFIAPNATVLGDVTVGEHSSLFFGAVARSEFVPIVIGKCTNIQDNCVLHADPGLPMTIGNGVTVGHGAILHSCTVGDDTLIGMGAIVLNGAVIGEGCIVAAGALVPQNAQIPPRSLVMGSPAKVRREVTEEELTANRRSAGGYVKEAAEYKEMFAE